MLSFLFMRGFLRKAACLVLPATAVVAEEIAPGVVMEKLAPPSAAAAGAKTRFTALGPDVTGFSGVNHLDPSHPLSYLYHSGMTCGGLAVGDFDGDGKPDVFFGGTTGPNALYRQTGNLKFENITAQCGGGLDGGDNWAAGVVAADMNGDGRLDIFVCNYMRPNQLFLNLGKGPKGEPVVFRECAKEAGLDLVDCSHSAAPADYDGDGKLDLYLLTNRIEDPAGAPAEMPIIKETNTGGNLPQLRPEMEKYYRVWRYDSENWGTEAIGTPDHLYKNTGNAPDGTPKFEDVSAKAGIEGPGDGLSVTWWDYDVDGRLDIYVANDFIAGDKLYHNNGDGTFTNTIKESVPHTPWFSMGADIGDVNNDLLPDLLVADMSATSHFKSKTTMGVMGGIDLKRTLNDSPPQLMRNALYINTGLGRFMEGAYLFKVSSTDWTWSVKFGDYDLDGWQDVYFTNGISRHMNDSDLKITQNLLVGKHMFEFFKDGEMRKEQHRVYRNTAHAKFEEASAEWGLDHVGVTYGSAYADLDRDGDLDLIDVNLEEPNLVYRNDSPASDNGHRLLIKLTGTRSNRNGLGAMVTIRTAGGSQMRQLQPQTGYLSGNEALVHFGLGRDSVVEEMKIHWPGGGDQILRGLAADRFYTITQPAEGGEKPAAKTVEPVLFAKADLLSGVKHKDDGWEGDFKVPGQSLLPWGLSQYGPGQAWSDVNGDGFPDLFLGNGAGTVPELRFGDGKGRFTAKWSDPLRADKDSESQGCVFFDADGDGDMDLLVAGGSNQFARGAKEQRDRLYLNDGKGNFTPAPAGALPEDGECSSAVCVADYDHDGKLDVFIGTRMESQHWPHAKPSRLLHNVSTKKGVKFEDVTAQVPGLKDAGLVTAAVWSDADADGWMDLLLAIEWGPVRYFHNEKGRLKDATEASGLAPVTGWWSGIAACDVDHDGDMDYVVSNAGLNTKYKQPALDHPHLTYVGDFDGTGKMEIVEVKREGDHIFPERGRSCSSRAMPFIASKFKTFKGFASASLTDIYTPEKLEKAEKFSCAEFQSGVFINDGGKFRFEPFDRRAQISPAFGVVCGDFNGDAFPDVFLAQNFIRGPQIETGPWDGGVGVFLLNDGQGHLQWVAPGSSGLVIPGDARSAVMTDLNGDNRPDLAVAINNGPMEAWTNEAQGARWLAVNLRGPKSAGAVVTFIGEGRAPQRVECAAGGGYLSQAPATAWFGLGNQPAHGLVTVIWSDGTKTEKVWDGPATTPLTIEAAK